MVKSTKLSFTCLMLYHGFVAALNCTSPTPKSLYNELEKTLFTEKLVRPVRDFADTLDISIGVTVVGIISVDEKTQTLTTVIWQVLQWKIYGLSWDEKDCGTTRVSILRENLWYPDVHITEFTEEDKSPITPYVYINSTGFVYDDKVVRVVSTCRLLIYTFPFDVQNCSLTFETYLHTIDDVRMTESTTAEEVLEESISQITTQGEWELIDVNVVPSTLVLEESIFSQVTYFIILKRRPVLYVVNLLIPSCFLVTVDLFSFLLPPHSVDRSAFKMTLILGYTVFLLIMNDLLPTTGETTPLINVFFSLSLALMVASLLETVIITNIYFNSDEYRVVPHWLSVLTLKYLAVLVCVRPKKRKNIVTVFLNPAMNSISSRDLQSISGDDVGKSHQDPFVEELKRVNRILMAIRLQLDKHFQGSKITQEWQEIGTVIDRLLFVMYIFFISVSLIIIISVWVQ
ncbi:5-hydroxytryptamine receptor 3A-like [Antennarius striatus]|uniref:5-hydroxytryptamine receptor 3A-like n=1 Tax=Antennarius striatus TaxID=241820 RepID=UPI0035AFEF98